jgi:hypothetical protein
MVMQSSGTITLQQIRNQWATSFVALQAKYAPNDPYAAVQAFTGHPLAPASYNLLAYRGTSAWSPGGLLILPAGTIQLQNFYGISGNDEWNCNCNCDCNCTSGGY